jgi:hypothetical protein
MEVPCERELGFTRRTLIPAILDEISLAAAGHR